MVTESPGSIDPCVTQVFDNPVHRVYVEDLVAGLVASGSSFDDSVFSNGGRKGLRIYLLLIGDPKLASPHFAQGAPWS